MALTTDFTRWMKCKAAAGEPISLAPGTYTLTDWVRFHQPGQLVFGSGRQNTVINYTGSDFRDALAFGTGSAYHQVARFTLNGRGTRPGTGGIGIGTFLRPGEATGAGTVSYENRHQDVLVQNFEAGLKVGNSALGVCGSDTVFDMCVYATKYGAVIDSANALDLEFRTPGLSGLAVGIWVKSGGSVFVVGGTSSLNTGPIMLIGGGGEFSVHGFRVEDSSSTTGVLIAVPGNPQFNVSVSAHDCEITGTGDATKYALKVSGNTVANVTSNRFMCCRGIEYTGVVAADKGILFQAANAAYDALLVNVDGAHPMTVGTHWQKVNPNGTMGSPAVNAGP